MEIKSENYKDRNLYVIDEINFNVLKNIIDKNYIEIETYKNDNRTYVAKISIDDKIYLLKKIFPRKKLKIFLSRFQDSESLYTFKNVEKLRREENISSLVEVLGAIEKRHNKKIEEEILVMKYTFGEKLKKQEDFIKTLKELDKIYKNNRFHGDCNPNNFIVENGEIKIIDTKLKPMWFGNYRKHFDFMVFRKHMPEKIKYPYHKNIYYYFAKLIRFIRDKKNKFRREK